MIHHCFVHDLSSIDENVESIQINEKEQQQYFIRHTTALHVQTCIDTSTLEATQLIENGENSSWSSEGIDTPQFYHGRRPRYRLFHINWKIKKNLKESTIRTWPLQARCHRMKQGNSQKIHPDKKRSNIKSSQTSPVNQKTRYRLNYIKQKMASCNPPKIGKKSNRSSQPLASRINDDISWLCNDTNVFDPINSYEKFKALDQRVVSKLDSFRSKMRLKSTGVDFLFKYTFERRKSCKTTYQ